MMADMLEDVGSVCGDEGPSTLGAQVEAGASGRAAGPAMSTIQGKYSSAGKNTLYFLVPDTPNLYLLDFKQRKFIKKKLATRLPMRATSAQTANGSIYVLGGMLPDQNYQQHAQRDCLMINPDLEMSQLARMPTARFDTPLALVHDKVVIALGGKTSKYHGTKRCEAFDTTTGQWVNVAPIPFFCVNTTAVVMKERYVYLMPGNNRETQSNSSLLVGYLDSGTLERGVEAALSTSQWAQLVVRNVDFVNSGPVAAIPLGPDQMLIFGGQTTKTFMLEDARADVNPSTGEATVRTCQSSLVQASRFASSCDFYSRSFDNFHYAIDAATKFLHMYKEREQEWEGQPLSELGIVDE